MADLTITVDDATLKRARIRAIERGESVNQYLAQQLREYADAENSRLRRSAVDFVALSRDLSGSSKGHGWTRGDIYTEQSADR